MKHFCRIAALFTYGVILALPLYASPSDELEKTKADLADSRAKQASIAEDQKKLEKELLYLQQLLVKSAGTTQKSEADMASAADKVRILNEQMRKTGAELAQRRKNLAAMAQAALHLNQVPPEAVAVMPNDEKSQSAMRAASILKMTSESIHKEMAEVQMETNELARLKKKAAGRQNDLTESQEDLAKQRQILKEKLDERKKLKEKLGRRQEEEEKRAAELAKKAENLQGLVSSVSRSDKGEPKSGRSFASAKGKIRMPVAGALIQAFGQATRDETNRGVVILAGTDDAQVVAPFDGRVVFAGTFLNYGKLVILKHSDDFHTLLAGMDDIDAHVGDFLLEGEPIGAMGNDEAGHRLYVELRKDNQPVNPEPWIKGLKK
jgi:septal ring factor EnvC (AmiA/AmiB activator)